MATLRRAEFPDTFTEHGIDDLWARPQSAIVRRIMDSFTGPNCIGGVSVDYRRIHIHPLVRKMWPRIKSTLSPSDEGPPVSPLFRRTRRLAACLGMTANAVEEVERFYGREEIRHGVVRLTRAGDVVAGLLPPYASFGDYNPYAQDDENVTKTDSRWRTLMYLTGPFCEVVAPALYVPKERRMLVPIKTDVLAENVPTDKATDWTYTFRTPVV